MFKGISVVKPGAKFSEIGNVIEEYANSNGFTVNREFGGHGIAHEMHLAPLVHHYKTKA